MRAVDVIRKKRDRGELTADEIRAFVTAAANGDWEKYQISALLMAIVLNGMSDEEIATLTRLMTDSGKVYDLSDLPGVKVDKHSTGGVGDKVSLVLAPLAAACGVTVPMMSGRGLGHTGGTLDKLEAIPGFRTNLSESVFRTALRTVGCAMIGQSAEVAPADKTLYALRDVTGTVESVPLITASILSKKIAEGISALVMDVKCGRGAFMKTLPEARELAESIQRVGTANGLTVRTFITDMDTPLGRAAGHSLEVMEAIETLKGNGPADLLTLCLEQATAMVELAGVNGQSTPHEAISGGAALKKFRHMVAHQGGDPRVVDDYSLMPTAPNVTPILAPKAGFIADMDPYAVGVAVRALGGGRQKESDTIDPAVGVIIQAKRGERVKSGGIVFEIHHRGATGLREAMELLQQGFRVSEVPPAESQIILERIR